VNLRTAFRLKLPNLTKAEADQALATERQNKKKKNPLPTGQSPGKTKAEVLFKYQHQDWMVKE
jgi:hypothetical protein